MSFLCSSLDWRVCEKQKKDCNDVIMRNHVNDGLNLWNINNHMIMSIRLWFYLDPFWVSLYLFAWLNKHFDLSHIDIISISIICPKQFSRTILITKMVFEFCWERISVNRNFFRAGPGQDCSKVGSGQAAIKKVAGFELC